MTLFQILMLGASAYFAFKIYEHIHTLEDNDAQPTSNEKTPQTFSPFSPEALLEKADTAFEEKEFDKAFALLTEANAKDPHNAEILFKLGYIAQQLSDDDEALSFYKQSLDIDNQNPFTHNAMASIYRKKQEFTSAKIHLQNSLEIDNENPITYFNFGNLLVDMQNIPEAINMYKKALEIDPNFQEAQQEIDLLKDKND